METKTQLLHAVKPFNQITIIGRRWFARNYGNTYHSCVVYVDGVEVGRVPYTYGCGDQYIQTAHKILQGAGVYPTIGSRNNGFDCDYSDFLRDRMNHRDKFVITVTDVERKKDL